MKPEDKIRAEFAARSVRRANSEYYDAETALELVRVCAESGIAVSGVSGYEFIGDDIYPTLTRMTADSAYKGDWEEWVGISTKGALMMIEFYSSKPGYMFYITLRSRETWKS